MILIAKAITSSVSLFRQTNEKTPLSALIVRETHSEKYFSNMVINSHSVCWGFVSSARLQQLLLVHSGVACCDNLSQKADE